MNLKLSSIGLLCAVLLLAGSFTPALARDDLSFSGDFSSRSHPELPLGSYAAGHLGVLDQGFARSYLVVAYRYLAGTPLNADEQAGALQLWRARLWVGREDAEPPWLAAWIAARKQVPGSGEAPPIEITRIASGRTFYYDFLNCPEDAFKNAMATLNDRVQKHGASSPAVLAWLQAQDQVFANCDEPNPPPAALPEDADPLQRADRAYQIASAQFYAGDFISAEGNFAAIALDAASPWKPLASYLVARSLIRRASIGPEAQADDEVAVAALLQEAEAQLNQVLAEAGSAGLHPAARRMLELVRMRTQDVERQAKIAQELLATSTDGTFYQDLMDYTTLLDHTLEMDRTGLRDQAETEPKEELTDWIQTFQDSGGAAYQHGLERWKSTQALPWLIIALQNASAGNADLPALLEAAAQVPITSAGYATVAYHRAWLLMEANKKEEARSVLDAALASADLPPSSRNRFLALRLRLARNLEELLGDAQRKPIAFSYVEGPAQEAIEEERLKWMEGHENNDPRVVRRMREKAPSFDTDGIELLSGLPLDLMAQAVASPSLPEPLRRDLAITAWSRAVLLGESSLTQQLTSALEGFWPELKPGLEAYRAAPTPEDQQFAVALLMLRFPGLSPEVHGSFGRLTRIDTIDRFRNNWWCNAAGESAKIPAFLDPFQQGNAASQSQRLKAIGKGPNWLVQRVLARAESAPNDPNLAEALHLSVRSTRNGCTDKDTGKLSKAAFKLLHRRFRGSEWAKKTPYWFN